MCGLGKGRGVGRAILVLLDARVQQQPYRSDAQEAPFLRILPPHHAPQGAAHLHQRALEPRLSVHESLLQRRHERLVAAAALRPRAAAAARAARRDELHLLCKRDGWNAWEEGGKV